MSKTTVERDWITAAGLRAIVLRTSMGHRCGYVGVPVGHPLHGQSYNAPCPLLRPISNDARVGKRGIIPLLCLAMSRDESRRSTPEAVFDVHGSLTFSGGGRGNPVDGNEWWFGFDCAHAGDKPEHGGTYRDEQYVADECESLARQIVEAVAQPQPTEEPAR